MPRKGKKRQSTQLTAGDVRDAVAKIINQQLPDAAEQRSRNQIIQALTDIFTRSFVTVESPINNNDRRYRVFLVMLISIKQHGIWLLDGFIGHKEFNSAEVGLAFPTDESDVLWTAFIRQVVTELLACSTEKYRIDPMLVLQWTGIDWLEDPMVLVDPTKCVTKSDKSSQLLGDLVHSFREYFSKPDARVTRTEWLFTFAVMKSIATEVKSTDAFLRCFHPDSQKALALHAECQQSWNETDGAFWETIVRLLKNAIKPVVKRELLAYFELPRLAPPLTPVAERDGNASDSGSVGPADDEPSAPAIELPQEVKAIRLQLIENIAEMKSHVEFLKDKGYQKAGTELNHVVTLLETQTNTYFAGKQVLQLQEAFPTFKRECENLCNTALTLKEADLSECPSYWQVVCNFLQTLTVLGLIIGLVRMSRGYSYGIFKIPTEAQRLIKKSQSELDKAETIMTQCG